MNLLIVDDLSSVVKGLENGISWKMLGISKVFTAYNAYEARKILLEYPVHIMLCDVEMPQENGIQLLSWMRSQNMDTECIFLTAHADFEYMQEAIRVKGFDYILQPAPYDEVRKAVFNAIQKIIEKQKHEQIYSYGKVLMDCQDDVKGSVFHELITGDISEKSYEEYGKAFSLPGWEQSAYPVLLQLEEDGTRLEEFGKDLLQFVLENIANELLMGYEQNLLVYAEDKNKIYFLIYGTSGYQMDYEGIKRQMGLFLSNIHNFLSNHAAIYCIDSMQVKNLKEAYQKLKDMCVRNVTLKEGLFAFEDGQRNTSARNYQFMSAERWKEYILNGYYDTVKEEILQFINELAREENLTHTSLHYFYIDFTHLINECISQREKNTYEFIEKTQNPGIYQSATGNLPGMIRFIEMVFDNLDKYKEAEEIQVGDFVKQYIHDHISQEIRRTDIAEELHLNVDYLARVFKKEMGMTMKEFILAEKMKVAKNLIMTTALPMSFIASKVGYENFSHFSQTYKKIYGVSPSGDRKQ